MCVQRESRSGNIDSPLLTALTAAEDTSCGVCREGGREGEGEREGGRRRGREREKRETKNKERERERERDIIHVSPITNNIGNQHFTLHGNVKDGEIVPTSLTNHYCLAISSTGSWPD